MKFISSAPLIHQQQIGGSIYGEDTVDGGKCHLMLNVNRVANNTIINILQTLSNNHILYFANALSDHDIHNIISS